MTPGWRDLGWAALVGAATLVANGMPLASPAEPSITAWLYSVLQFGLPAVVFIRLADAAVDARRLPAGLAYPAVVVATVVAGVWVIAPALQPMLGREDWWTPFNDARLASTTLVWHALGVGLYVQVRSSHQAQARLLVLQAQAGAHQRELAGARLAALQARVEPELLFERLQCIDAELRDHAPTARARLVALIDLLRAMQPHAQAAASNLAREIDAVRAFAALTSSDAKHSGRLELTAPPNEWPDWPLAPLVLLPLVRALLAGGQARWSLTLHSSGTSAELRLQALGPDATRARTACEHAPLAVLNERLRAVHGADASITLRPGSAHTLPSFSLRWPVPAAAKATTP